MLQKPLDRAGNLLQTPLRAPRGRRPAHPPRNLVQGRGWALSILALLAFAAAPSPAQEALLEVPSIIHHVNTSHSRVDMVVNTSRHLVMDDKKILQAQVNNPEIIEFTPLSANKIQISAKKPGVTQVNLWDQDNKIHTVDVVVFADAQELTLLLKTQFPKAALRVIPLANSVLITGYVDDPDEITRITEIAQDYHPKVINQVRVGGVQQVLLYVRVMEVSRTDLRRLGLDFSVFGGNGNLLQSGISGLMQANDVQELVISPTTTMAMTVVNGSSSLNGVLNCLRQNDLLKIVAEPNLVCVSGRPAFFNVGGEFPIMVPQSLGTISIQYKKFGTQLDFVPIVLGNNRIRLEVRPRVSEIDPTRSITIQGTTVPGLRVRETETGVEMRAGETLAIAGLVQQRVEGRKRGLPWLGDMPGIGVLFRSIHEEVQEIETLIMVTPQFVEAMECHEVPPGGPGLDTMSPTHCQLWCEGKFETPCGRFGTDVHMPGCDSGACCVPGAGGPIAEQDLIGAPPAGAAPMPETVPVPEGGASPSPQAGSQRGARISSVSQSSMSTHATPRHARPVVAPAGTTQGPLPAAESPSDRPQPRFNPDNLSRPRQVDPIRRKPGASAPPGLIGPAGYDLKNQ
jgi:pilus assembly protein CpaC